MIWGAKSCHRVLYCDGCSLKMYPKLSGRLPRPRHQSVAGACTAQQECLAPRASVPAGRHFEGLCLQASMKTRTWCRQVFIPWPVVQQLQVQKDINGTRACVANSEVAKGRRSGAEIVSVNQGFLTTMSCYTTIFNLTIRLWVLAGLRCRLAAPHP